MTAALPQVLIITGLMASGKSSVGQALAERLPRSVHLRGDLFRRLIVNGRVDVSPGASDDAMEQLVLRQEISCAACDLYAGAGFSVIYQDVILGQHVLDVCRRLERWSLGLVVLCPDLEVIETRDAERAKQAYQGGWTPTLLAAALCKTPRLGFWLDTSVLTVAETVDVIERQAHQTMLKLTTCRT